MAILPAEFKPNSTAVALPDSMAQRIAALREKASTEHDQMWRPEPGETVAGVLVGVDEVTHPQYGLQRQALLRDETGATWRVWLSRFLVEALRRQSADMGDIVAITFHGKESGKNGTYNRYSCTVDHVADRRTI